MAGVPTRERRGEFETQTHRHRGESHVGQRVVWHVYKPRITKDFLEPPDAGGEPGKASPSEPPEGNNTTDTSTSDSWPPELGDNTFLLFETTQFLLLFLAALG